MDNQFTEIIGLIQHARLQALKAVNKALINLYWNVGAYIAEKVSMAQWGDKTIDELARYIQQEHPDLKGFNRRGLYRMRQFYETYIDAAIVSSLRTQLQNTVDQQDTTVSSLRTQFQPWDIRDSILAKLSWTHHRTIFSRCQTMEEKIFYLHRSINENYTVQELDRQISAAAFERMMLSEKAELHKSPPVDATMQTHFKDLYVFEFLNLPEPFTENELQKALIQKMKTTEFLPEHLGQLNFYLEALDRDVKKPHENPSIGILLCKDKDTEVVEYALSRNLSPALVSQYQMALPDKKLLQAKLHELIELWENQKLEEQE